MPSKCEYLTCMRTKKDNPDIILHRFPVKNPDLLRKWITCSGNSQLLYLEHETLYRKYICGDHFTEESFMDAAHRKRLRPSAIPIHFSEAYKQPPSPNGTSQSTMTPTSSLSEIIVSTLSPQPSTSLEMTPLKEEFIDPPESPELKVNDHAKVYPMSHAHSAVEEQCSSFCKSEPEIDESSAAEVHYLQDVINMPPPPQKWKRRAHVKDQSPETQELKQKIKGQSRIIRNQKLQLIRLKTQLKKKKGSNAIHDVLSTFNFPSVNSKALVEMQFITRKREWTEAERDFSTMLFCKSSTVYNFLRGQGIILPGPSTIRRWLGPNKFTPGISNEYLDQKFEISREIDKKTTFEGMSVMDNEEVLIGELEV